MELRRISVNNLFGILNYDIDLGNSETIIITGPNGYGKTMLLKRLDNILNSNIDFFFDLRFSAIKFKLDTILPVSLTHLLAHETKTNLLCRRLLEKKS